MKIKLICVGKIKEKFYVDAIKEYSKRLGAYTTLEIIEVPDEKTPDKASEAINLQIKEKEGNAILSKIKPTDFVMLLDGKGKMYSSEELSELIENYMIDGKSEFVFIIGGSLGVSQQVKQRANTLISFSKMSFDFIEKTEKISKNDKNLFLGKNAIDFYGFKDLTIPEKIKNMVEEERYCVDILNQVSAIQAALNGFNKVILSNHIHTCVAEDIRAGNDEVIDELCETIKKIMK